MPIDPQLADVMRSRQREIDMALRTALPLSDLAGTERYNEALEYAVFPGGKRLRPQLTIAAARLCGASAAQSNRLGCAIEFLHTSSLILDDLPSMDDASFRRGRPSMHLVFGENVALLVALALMNQAYGLLAQAGSNGTAPHSVSALMDEATSCIGARGMIGGQAAELRFSGLQATGPALASRERKTSALMRLMMTAGAIVTASPATDTAALATFGERFGQAFQIYDDLIDQRSSALAPGAESGDKPHGQDRRHQRPTVTTVNTGGAPGVATTLLADAVAALDHFGAHAEARLLKGVAEQLAERLMATSPSAIDGVSGESR